MDAKRNSKTWLAKQCPSLKVDDSLHSSVGRPVSLHPCAAPPPWRCHLAANPKPRLPWEILLCLCPSVFLHNLNERTAALERLPQVAAGSGRRSTARARLSSCSRAMRVHQAGTHGCPNCTLSCPSCCFRPDVQRSKATQACLRQHKQRLEESSRCARAWRHGPLGLCRRLQPLPLRSAALALLLPALGVHQNCCCFN